MNYVYTKPKQQVQQRLSEMQQRNIAFSGKHMPPVLHLLRIGLIAVADEITFTPLQKLNCCAVAFATGWLAVSSAQLCPSSTQWTTTPHGLRSIQS